MRDGFQVSFTLPMLKIVIAKTNIEGSGVFRGHWKTVDYVPIESYIGLLILGGFYKSHVETFNNL